MGLWSAQCKDFKKMLLPLVELASTFNSVKGITQKGIIVQARAASPSISGAFTIFTKKRMRQVIPEEPARRDSTCLDGPTEKYACIIPRTWGY
jgi:hypothetical protein